MIEEPEEWRPVVGLEGRYEVSSLGRVRSCDYVFKVYGRTTCVRKGKLLALRQTGGYGGLDVTLKDGDGNSKREQVVTLVQQAFHIRVAPDETLVYRNENPLDCRVSNLVVVPLSEPGETWLPVEGWEGYEVSDFGRVRTLTRELGATLASGKRRTTRRFGLILKAQPGNHGYPAVLLCRESGRRRKLCCVHTLVCEAFHGPRPPGTEVLHRDGVRANARADNLRWGTRRQNINDMYVHGFAKLAGMTVEEAYALIDRR